MLSLVIQWSQSCIIYMLFSGMWAITRSLCQSATFLLIIPVLIPCKISYRFCSSFPPHLYPFHYVPIKKRVHIVLFCVTNQICILFDELFSFICNDAGIYHLITFPGIFHLHLSHWQIYLLCKSDDILFAELVEIFSKCQFNAFQNFCSFLQNNQLTGSLTILAGLPLDTL